MKELLTFLCNILQEGAPITLASVISQQGSAPRGTGSRLLADASGLLYGTVGGGLAEGATLEACQAALQDGKGRILDFLLSGELAAKSEMICGGRVRVLVEVVSPEKENIIFFRSIVAALHEEGATLITDITQPAQPRHSALIDGKFTGAALPKAALDALQSAATHAQGATISVDGHEYYVEHCLPPPHMIIAGGGHISRFTAQVAALAGFEVTVLDDRPEFSAADRFPWALRTRTVPDFANCFGETTLNSHSYVVIVTRGHVHDAAVLAQAITTRAGYIGMIGSTRKRREVYASLRAQGVAAETLNRVHCPIGLTIGAETPEEIAVSIVAECIAHRRAS